MNLQRLYPITDSSRAESHLDQVAAFVRGGATLVQVRDKRASGRELYEIVSAVVAYVRPLGVRIVVNDRVDVALAAGADGVHVGQDDLDARAAREILGPDRIVGLSTHSVEQARVAALLPVDYVAIGPVFSTATKANPDPVVGLDGVASVREAVGSTCLVAIGGITLETAADVLGAGADSVAVIADLWRTGDPATRTAEYFR